MAQIREFRTESGVLVKVFDDDFLHGEALKTRMDSIRRKCAKAYIDAYHRKQAAQAEEEAESEMILQGNSS